MGVWRCAAPSYSPRRRHPAGNSLIVQQALLMQVPIRRCSRFPVHKRATASQNMVGWQSRVSEDRRQRVQATARAAGRAVAAIHRDGRRRVLSAFAAADPAAMTGTSAAAPGTTGNASNKHAVRSSAATRVARLRQGPAVGPTVSSRALRERTGRRPVRRQAAK